jgi:2-haloacid dehalogenase
VNPRGSQFTAIWSRTVTAAHTVIFDIGNVLLSWDPRNLYRKIFADDSETMEWFLTEVCTPDWNLEQDNGRSWADAVAERITLFPNYADEIGAFNQRWEEMIAGVIEGSVDVLRALKRRQVPVFALTNFSAEKFIQTRHRYSFFDCFDGIVVSGEEKTVKPDREIYDICLRRYAINPKGAIFIDDKAENVAAANDLGLTGLLFTDADTLERDLVRLGLLG